MEIITQQDKLDSVISKWEYTYGEGQYGQDKIVILKELKELDPLTKEGIDKIIGNSSWTNLECDMCGNCVDATVQILVHDEYNYDMCNGCITEMSKVAKIMKEQIESDHD